MTAHIRFSERQLRQAQSLPRNCADTVIASATDTPVSYWRGLREAGEGPAHVTTVAGNTYYRRGDVLTYIHAHMKWGRPEC